MKGRTFAEEYPPYDEDIIVGYWYEGLFHQYITKCDEIGRFWVPMEVMTADSAFRLSDWTEFLYWCCAPNPPELLREAIVRGYCKNDIGRFY